MRILGSEDDVNVVVKVEVSQLCTNVWDLPVDTQCRLYGHVAIVLAVAVLNVGDGVFLARVSAASACTKEIEKEQQAYSVKR